MNCMEAKKVRQERIRKVKILHDPAVRGLSWQRILLQCRRPRFKYDVNMFISE